jgi:putative transposase
MAVQIRRHGCVERETAEESDDNALIADWMLRFTTANRRWGFGLCFLHLRNVKGMRYNHKRVYRIYRELELNLKIKPQRRLKRDRPDPLEVPRQINTVWSIDFMHDRQPSNSHLQRARRLQP